MDTDFGVIQALEEEAELLRRSLESSYNAEKKKQWQDALGAVNSLLSKYQSLEETRYHSSDPLAELYIEAYILEEDLNTLDRDFFESTTIQAFEKQLEHTLTLIEASTGLRPNIRPQPEMMLDPDSLSWEDDEIIEIGDDLSDDEIDSSEYHLSDEDELDHQVALGLAYEEYYNEYYNEMLNQHLSPTLAEAQLEKELENIGKFAYEQTLAQFQAPSAQQFGIFNQQQNKIAPVPTPTPQLTQQRALQPILSQPQPEVDSFHEALVHYNENVAALETMSDEDFERVLTEINREVQQSPLLSAASQALFSTLGPDMNDMSKSCSQEAGQKNQENLIYRSLVK